MGQSPGVKIVGRAFARHARTPEKPVGTVHIVVAGPDKEQHRKLNWPAPRPRVKWFSTQAALDLLRRTILTDTHT
jgi:nicotinamide mononucleotide (NMN) deamidase PncC